jgi:RND family efflux transporter MFP subunit
MENPMKTLIRSFVCVLSVALLAIIPACNGKQSGDEEAARREAGEENRQPASIHLTPAAMAVAEIRIAPVLKKTFRPRIAAPGELEFNARRLVHLTALTAGRIERSLTVAGDRVRAGQLLAEIYSPDYMSKQAEFLQATERADRFSRDPNEAGALRAFRESSRERLILLGATPAEVEELRRTRVPRPFLPVRAPFAGTIIEASTIPGDHVEIGANLFRLADLSVLWAALHVKEKDLSAVTPGSTVEIRTQAYPGELFPGRLLLVGDVLDSATRTVIGRVEVPNPAGKLKCGMYIEAFLTGADERTGLVVPESAIQDDGGRTIVFVQAAERVFVKREIISGEHVLGLAVILAGLAEGEKVVTSGSFLLKSELNKSSLGE